MVQKYEIPLSPQPQKFSMALAGKPYQLTVQWRGRWYLDIADASNSPLIEGIPLVAGTDLLGQYAYLGIGVRMWVETDSDPDADPTFDDLGMTSHLYFEEVG